MAPDLQGVVPKKQNWQNLPVVMTKDIKSSSGQSSQERISQLSYQKNISSRDQWSLTMLELKLYL